MTERDGNVAGGPEDGDPLLVRPYVGGEPRTPAPDIPAETWPQARPDPAPGSAVEPAGPAATPGDAVSAGGARTSRRRRALLIAGGAVALVTGLGVAGAIAALPSGPDRSPQAFTDVSLPPYSTPATAETPSAAASTAAPMATALSPSPRTTGSSTVSATSPPAPASTPAATPPPAGPAPAGPAPEIQVSSLLPTLPAVPPADRTGAISGAGNLCLDLNGGVPSDGNHVQVYECNGTSAQVWTLAADGTLRVAGKCAGPVDDGSVHIAGCDGRATAQWRAGPEQSLVHVATGDCLTDPSTGNHSGEWVRVAGCRGAANQRWRLP